MKWKNEKKKHKYSPAPAAKLHHAPRPLRLLLSLILHAQRVKQRRGVDEGVEALLGAEASFVSSAAVIVVVAAADAAAASSTTTTTTAPLGDFLRANQQKDHVDLREAKQLLDDHGADKADPARDQHVGVLVKRREHRGGDGEKRGRGGRRTRG